MGGFWGFTLMNAFLRTIFTLVYTFRGIAAVGDSVKAESGKDFLLSPKFGYIHSCPTNLGTGMRASVHVDLPGWTKDSIDGLKARCEALNLQPRGTRGESGGQTGKQTYLSNTLCQKNIFCPFTLAYFLDQNGHFELCVYVKLYNWEILRVSNFPPSQSTASYSK